MNPRFHLSLLAFPLVALMAGCTTNGYITSSVATVVGLDVSENPKTGVPHVKFGYARTGLYYVPTGKTAYGDPRRQGSGDAAGNEDSVKDTPTLVSEIFVHSKFLSEITISEKFAIGEAAVQSDAAVTTFANPAAQQVAASGGRGGNGLEQMSDINQMPLPIIRQPTPHDPTAAPRPPTPKTALQLLEETQSSLDQVQGQQLSVEMAKIMDELDAPQEVQGNTLPPKYPRTVDGMRELADDVAGEPQTGSEKLKKIQKTLPPPKKK